ncbi:hypothetical protein ABZ650_04780 [Streptomyces griseoviridis]|uniref:hypothetical protein n=1 Tax=Streptomyces griseoviridis TaxID=45398 RepID=UPI0033F5152F
MHRTTTTATLLVTVAVSALTGCVTVQRPPVSGPAAAPVQPSSAPRPEGRGGEQVVQAPAREALEMIGPSPRDDRPSRPHSAPSAAGSGTDSVPSSDGRPQAPKVPHAPPRPHPRAAHPEQRPRHPGHAPRAQFPDPAKGVPRSQADVCALGRKYGGWPADSPQSMVCGQTYGR